MKTKANNLSARIAKLGLWLMLLTVGFMCTAVRSEAAGTSIVKVQGNFLYSQSSNMLKYINDARKSAGSKALKLDPSLSAAAMQRAAELSVDFSHTRPNGKSCLTVTGYAADKGCSENITMGKIPSKGGAIAQTAFGSFQRSKGHNANMLNARHTAVGIGVFCANEMYYCVQIFSNTSKAGGSLPADKKETKKIELKDGRYKLILTCDKIKVDTRPGSSFKLKVSNANNGYNSYPYSRFHASSFVWKSSAPNVATVDQSGNVKCRKAGTVTITATPKIGRQKAASARITVYGSDAVYGNIAATPGQKVTGVCISRGSLTLNKGGKETLVATVLPLNAANRKITWSSTDTSVVKVDSNGQVTAVGRGTAMVQAITHNGLRTSCFVTVK